MAAVPCRHCNQSRQVYGRGLCRWCWSKADVKVLYDKMPGGRSSHTLFKHQYRDPPLDDQPTEALPGTPEKLAVMHDRARRGKQIFHPGDPVIQAWMLTRFGSSVAIGA
jgi:hypothetical protein